MGRLTTHVLDTATGKPAAGLTIDLYRIDQEPVLLKSIVTNDDGRADGPLLVGETLTKSVYELRFHVGDYLKGLSMTLPEPLFLDVVPIRFGIAEPGQHYHVPLLISPFGYSTYRGS